MKIKSTIILTTALGCAASSAFAGSGFTSVEQICGKTSLICVDLDDDNYNNHYQMSIEPGENENEIIFKNFYYIEGYDVPATVDLEAGTVTFRKLMNFKFIDNYDGMSNFLLYKWNATHTRASSVDEMVGTLSPDGTGTITFDPDYYFSIVVPEGIAPNPMGGGSSERGPQIINQLGSYEDTHMYFQPMDHTWVYFPEQWEYAGQAELTGMWIAPFAGFNNGSVTLSYKVDYLTNKADSNILLIANPYGVNTPWTDAITVSAEFLNTSGQPGYIFIDARDADFVKLYTGVSSGYSSERFKRFDCFNEEGYNASFCGYDKATSKSVLNYFGSYTYSERKGNDITVRNLMYWSDKEHYLEDEGYVSTIKLYPGEESSGASVIVDSDTTTRYYNLQGIELSNPLPGQILIERSVSGSRKVIF